MHEIVTIQIGEQSNYLGTHFWNAQESYFTYDGQEESPVDHNIHFRPGIGSDGSDTFTSRALVYDLKESFGTLRQSNALYALQHEASPLEALRTGTALVRQPEIEQHPYQQYLNSNSTPPELTPSSIRFWSDFNRVYYHPKSLVQLHPDPLTSTLGPLRSWNAGAELFESEDREHDVLDRDFRYFAEECDQMQGVVMIAGIDDAWGGFAARYAERLRDEIGKGVLWVWGLDGTLTDDGRTRERRQQRLVNSIRSTHALSSQASVYIPVVSYPEKRPPYLAMECTSKWHTSALQAAIVETLSLPSRMRSSSNSRSLLADMEQLFTAASIYRKILQAEMTVKSDDELHVDGVVNGIDHAADQNLIREDSRPNPQDESSSALDIPFFPSIAQSTSTSRGHLFSRLNVARGEKTEPILPSSGRADPTGTQILSYSPNLTFPVLSSYPTIFGAGRSTLSLQASLSSSSNVASWLRGMADQSRMLGRDEREEISSELRTWADEYVEGWESADEDDWDD